MDSMTEHANKIHWYHQHKNQLNHCQRPGLEKKRFCRSLRKTHLHTHNHPYHQDKMAHISSEKNTYKHSLLSYILRIHSVKGQNEDK
jgi:hypothetical protein